MINDNIHNNVQFTPSASSSGVGEESSAGLKSITFKYIKQEMDAVHSNFDEQFKNISQFVNLQVATAEGSGRQEGQEIEKANNYEKNNVDRKSSSSSSLDIMSTQNNEELNDDELDKFIDIPNLISDSESDEIKTVSTNYDISYWNEQRSLQPTPATIQTSSVASPTSISSPTQQHQQSQQPQAIRSVVPPSTNEIQIKKEINESLNYSLNNLKTQQITQQQFKYQRNQLMIIIVKYVATKIYNTFPPNPTKNSNELPLDKFLLLLTSRLKISLNLFLKSIIYLFRYMDIIYLLRYLNQTNNFVNYNDMGFELKKLIIGCFKLTILKENKILKQTQAQKSKNLKQYKIFNGNEGIYKNLNWEKITGLKNQEINKIVNELVARMNGKLNIKDVEVARIKNELYRFVKQ
ncbi:uncharacterized protein KGF55_001719 [Candida pseudojiufengensis]|uniref:uncharacterized protein n=1 Tax=Candida pseudojiufengensis TaxID=497109 RepID=UPI0022250A6D|nr:uncharacterized protein KGF55_001719 [Candida pseudojiufengensis]KAI5964650.1 hypothetical protein KGF55_001719 [Candida pseudojiufengensis]